MKLSVALGVFITVISLEVFAEEDINLSDYLIPQDKLLGTSLSIRRGTSIKLTFDRDSSTYIESPAVIATKLDISDTEKQDVSEKSLGTLKIDIGLTNITLAQHGSLPLVNNLQYIDDGFIVELPKRIPNFYSKMLNDQLQLIIARNFKAIVNINRNLVLTDCISLEFKSLDGQFSATKFCKGIGPAQIIINGGVEVMLDGWEFKYPEFGQST